MNVINRRWFSMQADANAAEISVFDEVGGWGVTVADFKKELDAVKGAAAITLSINSPGGDVFAGMALYNLLLPLKARLSVRVLGLAASISSIIALAGKSLTMAEGAYFMIHNPWTIAAGTEKDLIKTAGLLGQIGASMADIYAARSGKKKAEILALMEDETWMDAQQAVTAGFANAVEPAAQIAALADISKFNFQHAPRAVIDRAARKPNPPATARDFERYLRDGGYSRNVAEAIAAKGFSAVSKGSEAGSGEPREMRRFFSVGAQTFEINTR